jgi:hypothetical protein
LEQLLDDEATKWTGDWTDEPLPGLVIVMPANAEVDETRKNKPVNNRGEHFRMKQLH